MTTTEWVTILAALVVQSVGIGIAWENLRGRVKRAEDTVTKLEKALEILADNTAKKEATIREDEKILRDLDELRKEVREGFVYFGECLGNLTSLTNSHDSWLSAMEARVPGAQGSRPRMPAVRAPSAPGWMPPRAHVVPPKGATASAGAVSDTGQYRTLSDPRREKP